MRLELRAGNPSAAARLQLRAAGQCPGVKGLWLDALRPPLLRHVPPRLFRDTVELLQEKELRLCVEIPAGGGEELEAGTQAQVSRQADARAAGGELGREEHGQPSFELGQLSLEHGQHSVERGQLLVEHGELSVEHGPFSVDQAPRQRQAAAQSSWRRQGEEPEPPGSPLSSGSDSASYSASSYSSDSDERE
jgi:hypothetical protein